MADACWWVVQEISIWNQHRLGKPPAKPSRHHSSIHLIKHLPCKYSRKQLPITRNNLHKHLINRLESAPDTINKLKVNIRVTNIQNLLIFPVHHSLTRVQQLNIMVVKRSLALHLLHYQKQAQYVIVRVVVLLVCENLVFFEDLFELGLPCSWYAYH